MNRQQQHLVEWESRTDKYKLDFNNNTSPATDVFTQQEPNFHNRHAPAPDRVANSQLSSLSTLARHRPSKFLQRGTGTIDDSNDEDVNDNQEQNKPHLPLQHALLKCQEDCIKVVLNQIPDVTNEKSYDKHQSPILENSTAKIIAEAVTSSEGMKSYNLDERTAPTIATTHSMGGMSFMFDSGTSGFLSTDGINPNERLEIGNPSFPDNSDNDDSERRSRTEALHNQIEERQEVTLKRVPLDSGYGKYRSSTGNRQFRSSGSVKSNHCDSGTESSSPVPTTQQNSPIRISDANAVLMLLPEDEPMMMSNDNKGDTDGHGLFRKKQMSYNPKDENQRFMFESTILTALTQIDHRKSNSTDSDSNFYDSSSSFQSVVFQPRTYPHARYWNGNSKTNSALNQSQPERKNPSPPSALERRNSMSSRRSRRRSSTSISLSFVSERINLDELDESLAATLEESTGHLSVNSKAINTNNNSEKYFDGENGDSALAGALPYELTVLQSQSDGNQVKANDHPESRHNDSDHTSNQRSSPPYNNGTRSSQTPDVNDVVHIQSQRTQSTKSPTAEMIDQSSSAAFAEEGPTIPIRRNQSSAQILPDDDEEVVLLRQSVRKSSNLEKDGEGLQSVLYAANVSIDVASDAEQSSDGKDIEKYTNGNDIDNPTNNKKQHEYESHPDSPSTTATCTTAAFTEFTGNDDSCCANNVTNKNHSNRNDQMEDMQSSNKAQDSNNKESNGAPTSNNLQQEAISKAFVNGIETLPDNKDNFSTSYPESLATTEETTVGEMGLNDNKNEKDCGCLSAVNKSMTSDMMRRSFWKSQEEEGSTTSLSSAPMFSQPDRIPSFMLDGRGGINSTDLDSSRKSFSLDSSRLSMMDGSSLNLDLSKHSLFSEASRQGSLFLDSSIQGVSFETSHDSLRPGLYSDFSRRQVGMGVQRYSQRFTNVEPIYEDPLEESKNYDSARLSTLQMSTISCTENPDPIVEDHSGSLSKLDKEELVELPEDVIETDLQPADRSAFMYDSTSLQEVDDASTGETSNKSLQFIPRTYPFSRYWNSNATEVRPIIEHEYTKTNQETDIQTLEFSSIMRESTNELLGSLPEESPPIEAESGKDPKAAFMFESTTLTVLDEDDGSYNSRQSLQFAQRTYPFSKYWNTPSKAITAPNSVEEGKEQLNDTLDSSNSYLAHVLEKIGNLHIYKGSLNDLLAPLPEEPPVLDPSTGSGKDQRINFMFESTILLEAADDDSSNSSLQSLKLVPRTYPFAKFWNVPVKQCDPLKSLLPVIPQEELGSLDSDDTEEFGNKGGIINFSEEKYDESNSFVEQKAMSTQLNVDLNETTIFESASLPEVDENWQAQDKGNISPPSTQDYLASSEQSISTNGMDGVNDQFMQHRVNEPFVQHRANEQIIKHEPVIENEGLSVNSFGGTLGNKLRTGYLRQTMEYSGVSLSDGSLSSRSSSTSSSESDSDDLSEMTQSVTQSEGEQSDPTNFRYAVNQTRLTISKLLFSDEVDEDEVLGEKPWVENASYSNPATIALSLGSQGWDTVFASTTSDHSLGRLSGGNSGHVSTGYSSRNQIYTSGRRLFGFGKISRGPKKEIRLDKETSKNSLSSTSEPTSSHHSTGFQFVQEFQVQRPSRYNGFHMTGTNVRPVPPPKAIRQSLGNYSFSPNRNTVVADSKYRRSIPYMPPRPLTDTSGF